MNPSIEQREQLARFLWTGFIVMFFAIQAIIWTIAILLTSNDDSHAVVFGFDERAGATLSPAERQEANQQSGWTLNWTWSANADTYLSAHQLELTIEVRDREGKPVDASSIELAAFHCAQASKVQKIELILREPGIYQGKLDRHRSGQWQFEGVIHSADQLFYMSDRFFL
jgi:nitrogen fixation protein FixH